MVAVPGLDKTQFGDRPLVNGAAYAFHCAANVQVGALVTMRALDAVPMGGRLELPKGLERR